MSDDEGFFSRWSRRKAQRRSGEALPAAPAGDAAQPPAAVSTLQVDAAPVVAPPPAAAPRVDAEARSVPVLPLPTIADVAQLTPTSDFSRFVASGVEPSVQHAALKTLFSDPHFNEMDGLDTYIGDYNTPNPIPDAMRRRLEAHAAKRVLDASGLASDAPPAGMGADTVRPAAALPDGAPALSLPQSRTPCDIEPLRPGTEADEDLALRLQPDDAAGAPGAGSDRPGSRA